MIVVPRNLNELTVLTDELLKMSGEGEDVHFLKPLCISGVLRALSSRLFQIQQAASCRTSWWYFDSSPLVMEG